jgi:hypothetical protein
VAGMDAHANLTLALVQHWICCLAALDDHTVCKC